MLDLKLITELINRIYNKEEEHIHFNFINTVTAYIINFEHIATNK